MSISGSLEDVAVGDVLQFIHLGKRTGTLELERDGGHARFGFHEGALIAAQAPGAPRLGELLIEKGHIDAATLSAAMARQASASPRRSLGRLLVEEGLLRRAELESVVRLQLELAVEQVHGWERGSFDFALDEIRPIDEIGTEAFEEEEESGRAPNAPLASNVVLLEAARIFDERDRLGVAKTLGEASDDAFDGLIDEESGTLAGPVLRVLSPDREFVRQLRAAVGPQAILRRVTLARASDQADEGDSDILLIDVRADALDPELLGALHAARPEARLVVLVDSNAAMQVAYRHGAVAAVPAELETVRACVANLLETATVRGAAGTGSAGNAGRGEPGLRRLQRVFGDLKSGLASATVALNLMQLVSESYERAVIFLVKRDRLAPLGAFGFARNGSPLAGAVRRLEIKPSGLLQEALASSQVRTATFQNANLPIDLAAALGQPAYDQVVVFPVAGSERVIAAVYADNGDNARPLRDVELLEVAAEQVGIAFENELLRRQLGR